jgi:hypothetical protein
MVRIASALLLLTLSSACGGRKQEVQVPLPAQLVVLSGARNMHSGTKPDGSIEVSYHIAARFPAGPALEQIRAALPRSDWEPLANDWLNPDIPSSHQRGWTDFTDGTKTPNTAVHLWLAQWRNRNGDIVLYGLRYDSRDQMKVSVLHHPDNDDLHVVASWIPAATARRMIEWAEKTRRTS